LAIVLESWAAPWLRQVVVSLSPWTPRFDFLPDHVWFMVDKVALGWVLSE